MTRTLASVTALAATLALGAAALAQSKPLGQHDPIDATSNSAISSSSMWSMTTSENGRTFTIASKDGVLSAQIDGKAVPADRVVQEDDTVRIKDEKGETIFQTQVPSSNAMTITTSPGGLFGLAAPRARSRSFGPGNHSVHVQVAAPPVMIGVQLLDPDASIRGHLGLKENEATMVSAVYEGFPAALAGLEPYDIIIGVGDKTSAPPATVREALRTTEAGKSVSLKVIHRGQEKTISITPEKYDADKLEKAKINAIAAASNAPNALAANIDPDAETWVRALGGNNAQPFVATTPGKPMTIWVNPFDGAGGGQSMNDFAKRMQEMAEQMRAQAESARQDAQHLREQILRQQQGGAAAPGQPGPGMDDRMKKMEEMLQKLMEQREKKADDKSDPRSLLTQPARDVFTWRPAPSSPRA